MFSDQLPSLSLSSVLNLLMASLHSLVNQEAIYHITLADWTGLVSRETNLYELARTCALPQTAWSTALQFVVTTLIKQN